jgi:hypothetical protein
VRRLHASRCGLQATGPRQRAPDKRAALVHLGMFKDISVSVHKLDASAAFIQIPQAISPGSKAKTL